MYKQFDLNKNKDFEEIMKEFEADSDSAMSCDESSEEDDEERINLDEKISWEKNSFPDINSDYVATSLTPAPSSTLDPQMMFTPSMSGVNSPSGEIAASSTLPSASSTILRCINNTSIPENSNITVSTLMPMSIFSSQPSSAENLPGEISTPVSSRRPLASLDLNCTTPTMTSLNSDTTHRIKLAQADTPLASTIQNSNENSPVRLRRRGRSGNNQNSVTPLRPTTFRGRKKTLKNLNHRQGGQKNVRNTATTTLAPHTRKKKVEDLGPTIGAMVNNGNWSCVDKKLPALVFTGVPGVRAPNLNRDSTILDVFYHFCTTGMIKTMKIETNRYAQQMLSVMKPNLKPKSIWHSWKTVTFSDIEKFLTIILHMCLIGKANLADYWSTNEVLHSPFASSVMSRDRFRQIMFMFHLNDNSKAKKRGDPDYDPLFKLRPYFDELTRIFRETLYPSQNLVIDEGVCPFRGKISFRVYIKNKPDRYGIKLYIICDSKTGYILGVEIYCGSVNGVPNTVTSVIDRLTSPYFGRGHVLYMDRFYSGPEVFDWLFSKNTGAVGTVMPNRKGMPPLFKHISLQKSQMIFFRRNHLLAIKWKDTRDVYALSTIHSTEMEEVKIRVKGTGVTTKEKPKLILDYNLNKTGVDRADQNLSYYPFRRKTLKWWKKLFFHLFMRGVVNAHLTYNLLHSNNKLSLQNFILKICESLASKYPKNINKHGNSQVKNQENILDGPESKPMRLTERHFVEKIPPTLNTENPTRRCHIHHKHGVRKETAYYCAACQKALCLFPCFKDYHTKIIL